MNPDPGWIASILLIIGNLLGWGFIVGKLNGRVKNLEETAQRHEKTLNNGIVQKLSGLQSQVSNLEGTVQTYINLKEGPRE